VDACAFTARCTAAGLNEGNRERFTSSAHTIELGLYPDPVRRLDSNPVLDCHIMGSAQYILIAGDVIDAECVKRQLPPHRHHTWRGWADGQGPAVWKRWGDRLAEIADALDGRGELGFTLYEENREALTDMVVRARDKMVALEPEMFAHHAEPGPQEGSSSGP
jgi:hypothetical protein